MKMLLQMYGKFGLTAIGICGFDMDKEAAIAT